MSDDKKSASKDTPKKPAPMPPEGPHARPDLTDKEKTPGTGSLPDPDTKGVDIGPG
ncbi:hypothetical protein OSH10_18300 [Kaistia defluvii]|uniref:hypothetical protein n=1 Tax=Kaistia defluvii TaxID=410841 RepID=UPI0022514785|nr:hypothetical protein [Kaistia defluvii]MCX5520396.1 hypothetical protein [Kaistia defluvii]